MKTVLISAVVAVIASLATLHVHHRYEASENLPGDAVSSPTAPAVAAVRPVSAALSYTPELVEDAWVNGARTAGIDHKPLADSANSICYLTTVVIKGERGPTDADTCRIEVDDFTGFWEVVAEVEEGGQSEIRCNARCLVWNDPSGTGPAAVEEDPDR
jgi:hypothetical protein